MPSRRDPWLDNAKMLLVTLVVVRHSWMLLPGGAPSDRIGEFLYAWHMPAFALVTGYLSRGFTWEGRRLWRLVCTVLVPCALFEALLLGFRVVFGGEHVDGLGEAPVWPLWFLVALFAWRLLAPVFRRIPAAVWVAVVVSVVAGVADLHVLDAARTLGLLPFFVLGLVATPERLGLLRRPGARPVAVAVLVVLWLLSGHLVSLAGTRDWLYYKDSYAAMGVPLGSALLIRLAMLAVGTAGSLAFLALVPQRGGRFARMGEWTLVVYLFHGFAVLGLRYTAFPDWSDAHPIAGFVVTSIGGVLLALALAWPHVARRLHPVVDPVGVVEEQVTDAVRLTQTVAPGR